ncbi:magnesium-translocating P-type ATPase [Mycobacterium yunnanensis]|uniref:Magnesium-transporting ATPase, P-type 1 n=1 Tax=Mycobacterium yunnanensis TaxID=368477 RepID=A0A9X2Z7R0_9MYCO|nr:magnesium-translocating P-type ATPase [Mycobacterium yunnanensis]MCV7423714.1 magnesium-translocating P-type ATPase [Mycobacterium yunnanensis]
MALQSLVTTRRGPTPSGDEPRLAELANAPSFVAFQRLASSPNGLTEQSAAERAAEFGENRPGCYVDDRVAARVVAAVRSPFVALLSVLGMVLIAVGDQGGAVTVAVVVSSAVGLRLWQQTRADRAVRGLRRQSSTTATVRRRPGAGQPAVDREVSVRDLVPGDVVVLVAGDVVPADLRIVTAAGLMLDQAVVSGESMPVPKAPPAADVDPRTDVGFDTSSLCFTGTTVVSGTGTALVVATGPATLHDALARTVADLRPTSSFEQGVRTVGLVLIRFMLVMAPVVFVVSGLVTEDWRRAALSAVSVAVGLTPEMLPVIVTANLARGATRLARDRVIVNRLEAIQDLGAMDVLCVDKTGTLTEDRVVYAHAVDPAGAVDDSVGELAHLAVSLQDCPYDVLDEAIVERMAGADAALLADAAFDKVDEIAFDHTRRLATVVVRRRRDEHILVTHGDPSAVIACCDRIRLAGNVIEMDDERIADAMSVVRDCGARGMRTLAVAVRDGRARLERYTERDEHAMVLIGFLGFVDPVRVGADAAIETLAGHGVAVKMLTGDGEDIARIVAERVGLAPGDPVLGSQVDAADDAGLGALVEGATVFARLTPAHKARIVGALRSTGHTVGFIGDGVNDVPALRVADAGIAADDASDAAKGAADLILLEDGLDVLARGVIEGRRTLSNTMKYVKITASSNFGNVFTVLIASAFLPFLPMLPVQFIVQNLLYDAAQLALAWDRAEDDYLRSPRRWNPSGLVRFMLWFGPLSSLFDVATFAVLWWIFDTAHRPAPFHTGWFVEGLLTQLLIVLVLRVRTAPWRGAGPSRPVVVASSGAAAVGLLLPLTSVGARLGLVALPWVYLLWIAAAMTAYALSAQFAKRCYVRRHADWL